MNCLLDLFDLLSSPQLIGFPVLSFRSKGWAGLWGDGQESGSDLLISSIYFVQVLIFSRSSIFKLCLQVSDSLLKVSNDLLRLLGICSNVLFILFQLFPSFLEFPFVLLYKFSLLSLPLFAAIALFAKLLLQQKDFLIEPSDSELKFGLCGCE